MPEIISKFSGSFPLFGNIRADLPYIEGVLINLESGEDIGFSDKFLIDTGASLSILSGKYSSSFENLKILSEAMIQYGSGP